MKTTVLFICCIIVLGCISRTAPAKLPYQIAIEKYAQKFSNDRPQANILSEREAVTGALEYIHNKLMPDVELYKARDPDWQAVGVGSIVLVEDLWSARKEKEPYYYFLAATKPNGDIVAGGNVSAAADTATAGSIIDSALVGEQNVPTKVLSKEQAVALVRKEMGIGNHLVGKVKAVLVPNQIRNRLGWGWAVQFVPEAGATQATTTNPETYWVNYNVYDLDYMRKRKISTHWMSRQILLGEFSENIFLPEVCERIRKLTGGNQKFVDYGLYVKPIKFYK